MVLCTKPESRACLDRDRFSPTQVRPGKQMSRNWVVGQRLDFALGV